jgi:hypothetical protein
LRSDRMSDQSRMIVTNEAALASAINKIGRGWWR